MKSDKLTAIFDSRFINVTLFLLFFLVDAVFRIREYDDKGIDFQVLVKLGLLFLCFLIGVNSIRYKIFYAKCLWLLLFLFFLFMSSLYSPDLFYGLYLSFSYMAVFLFIFYCFLVIGYDGIIIQAAKAFFAFTLISVFLYVFFPSLGRFSYWEFDVFFTSSRMSGLAGSANNFARIMAVYIIILCFYRNVLRTVYSIKIINLQLFFALSCLLLSGSRTTIAALFACLLLFVFLKLNSKNKARFVVLVLALTIVLTYFLPILLTYSSRHGGADLASFTGRIFIWDVSLELIKERLYFGYGMGSSVFLLPDYLSEVGFKASHAHNMYFQILLTVGFLGLLYFILLIIFSVIRLFHMKEYGVICLLALICVVGLLESGAFALTANIFTVFLFIALVRSRDSLVSF